MTPERIAELEAKARAGNMTPEDESEVFAALREHEDETMTGCLNDALSDLEDELDEMARMENSWHWPGCPNAVRKERSDA